MKPYYFDEAVTIYHADCRDVLPSLKADLVLTDPPYGIGEAKKAAARATDNAVRGGFGSQPTFHERSDWDDKIYPEVVEQAISCAKYACVFGGNFYPLPPSSCWLIWDKDNKATDFADAEMAWTNFPKAVRLIKWRWNGALQELGGKDKEKRVHPTQKPIAVMRWCIQQTPNEPQLILDPFMGSGTTLRAAKDLGRKAIGIEIEERYCEIAAKRMAQTAMML